MLANKRGHRHSRIPILESKRYHLLFWRPPETIRWRKECSRINVGCKLAFASDQVLRLPCPPLQDFLLELCPKFCWCLAAIVDLPVGTKPNRTILIVHFALLWIAKCLVCSLDPLKLPFGSRSSLEIGVLVWMENDC